VSSIQNAKDLLSHLLVRDPKARLGSGEADANEIKAHPFFAEIDWTALATGKLPSPWVPTVAGSLDTSQFDQEFTSMMPIGKQPWCICGVVWAAGFSFL
jgi:serine/threonine protein kinase